MSQKQRLVALLLTLGLVNAAVWGSRGVTGTLTKNLYSSGLAFSSDGTPLKFSDKLQFKGAQFNFSVKYTWNNKTNTMQETGTARHGLWGEWLLVAKSSSSFGPSLLAELDLDEDLLFARSYMQSGHATLNALPLPGDFAGRCYYLIFMKKVYCGTSSANPLPALPDSASRLPPP